MVDPNLAGHDYYGILRRESISAAQGDLQAYVTNPTKYESMAREQLTKRYGIVGRPLDKSENYVKRCVGLPGEVLEVVAGDVMINGEILVPPAGVQFEYEITFNSQLDARRAIKSLELTNVDLGNARMDGDQVVVVMALTEAERVQLESGTLSQSLLRMEPIGRRGSLEMFPNVQSTEFDQWDPDHVGPILIPKKGLTVTLDERNIALYRRAIDVYEEHDFQMEGKQVFIDGEAADSFTFGQDYYWMMGDNRHRSADSRMWGFVPETHVVGRASFIWFSKQNKAQHGESKIRWNRMFRSVK